jgi:hypothetical protein
LPTLDFHNCSLSGNGSATLGGCGRLRVLDLSANRLTALPIELPASLTHLYLGDNPLAATAAKLGTALRMLPALAALDIAFFGLSIQLGSNGPASGTRVMVPAGCRLGPGAPACALMLQLYDNQDQPVKVGGLKPNLTLGADCDEYETTCCAGGYPTIGRRNCRWVSPSPMADGGDGTYTAIIPLDWAPNSTSVSPLIVGLFDRGVQFFPAFDSAGNSHYDWLDLGGVPIGYGPAECSMATHTVPNPATGLSSCTCLPGGGFVPDTAAAAIVAANHTNGSAATAALVCRQVCARAGEEVVGGGGGCQCKAGWYNATAAGLLVCVTSGWSPAAAPRVVEAGDCQQCPTECATCKHGAATISAGWRLNVTMAHEIRPQILRAAGTAARLLFVFSCPEWAGCPPIALERVELEQVECLANTAGQLCGSCLPGYSRTQLLNATRLRCVSCADLDAFSALASLVAAVVVGLVVASLRWFSSKHTRWILALKGSKREVFTNLKILIGLAQVLSLLSGALDLLFPHPRVMSGLSLASA